MIFIGFIASLVVFISPDASLFLLVHGLNRRRGLAI